MLLMRHNRLAPPYDDYSQLSFGELEKLATKAISPSTQSFSINDIKDRDLEYIRAADKLIISESSRSRETCQEICSLCSIDKTIEIDGRINEIYFEPSQMDKGRYQSPLETVRDNLFELIRLDHEAVEAKSDLLYRIEKIYKEYRGKAVVLFSHGFLINLIDAYAESVERNRSFDHALMIASKKKPIKYLQSVLIK